MHLVLPVPVHVLHDWSHKAQMLLVPSDQVLSGHIFTQPSLERYFPVMQLEQSDSDEQIEQSVLQGSQVLWAKLG